MQYRLKTIPIYIFFKTFLFIFKSWFYVLEWEHYQILRLNFNKRTFETIFDKKCIIDMLKNIYKSDKTENNLET